MRKFLLVIPLMIVALGVTVIGYRMTHDVMASRRFNDRVAELTSRGEPIDNETLAAHYRSTTSDVLTDEWVLLGDQFEARDFHYLLAELPVANAETLAPQVVPGPGVPWQNRATVDDFVAQWDREWATLQRLAAAQFEHAEPVFRPCRFNSTESLVPEVQNAQWCGQLLRLKHRIAVYDGDTQTAFAAIRACQAIEQSLLAEPLIVSQLVRSVLGNTACRMISHSLEHDQLSDRQMDEIEANLIRFSRVPELYVHSMRGERALVLPVYSDPAIAAAAAGIAESSNAASRSVRGVDGNYYLDKMDAALNVSTDTMKSFLQSATDLNNQIRSECEAGGRAFEYKRLYAISLLPAFEPYAKILVEHSEETELARLAMAVRRYEHRSQRWPQSLNELEDIGHDESAFRTASGEPFGYSIHSDHVLIWGTPNIEGQAIPTVPSSVDWQQNKETHQRLWRLKLSPHSGEVGRSSGRVGRRLR